MTKERKDEGNKVNAAGKSWQVSCFLAVPQLWQSPALGQNAAQKEKARRGSTQWLCICVMCNIMCSDCMMCGAGSINTWPLNVLMGVTMKAESSLLCV